MNIDVGMDVLEKNLLLQLNNFWTDIDNDTIRVHIPYALERMEKVLCGLSDKNKYVWKSKAEPTFSVRHSVQYSCFLYLLSHCLFREKGGCAETEAVYYLNKIMHACDWFYAIELPEKFYAEHPIGSVMGRAKYGECFFFYQGCTVGGNTDKNQKLTYPVIGNNVLMYSNSSILGDSSIGDNVILSSGCRVINQSVPDNSIVFGWSPNLIVKQYTKEEMTNRNKIFKGGVNKMKIFMTYSIFKAITTLIAFGQTERRCA